MVLFWRKWWWMSFDVKPLVLDEYDRVQCFEKRGNDGKKCEHHLKPLSRVRR